MASILSRYLPFASTTTPLQAITYLLFVSLFSISFLVFLNSSISFVITDLLGVKHGVGDLVGTLGFADELVALVACPFWGIVSDRLGVRWVCALGYAIVGISLLLLVQATNVYPQLLIARLGFSVGGAATATMVTVVLPSMTGFHSKTSKPRGLQPPAETPSNNRHSAAFSVESGATITPELYSRQNASQSSTSSSTLLNTPSESVTPPLGSGASSPPRLAGIVGIFTGCGALLALSVFLPLPTKLSHFDSVTQAQAVAYSFYIVGIVALFVSGACFLGLRNLKGEEGKGWSTLLNLSPKKSSYSALATSETEFEGPVTPPTPFYALLLEALKLAGTDHRILLAYTAGFVARASSVAISLFIPLSINAYFIGHSFCTPEPGVSPNDPEFKEECRAAYVLASQLTGGSQLVALLCAPIFGWASDRYRRWNAPLLVTSVAGIIGFIAFAKTESPEIKGGERGGGPAVILWVSLIGISQIGAIVCSLGLLGRGVQGDEIPAPLQSITAEYEDDTPAHPQQPNIHAEIEDANRHSIDSAYRLRNYVQASSSESESRVHLKGSVAGVYSLFGGMAILLLTKVGGKMFDSVSKGAPFYMMAGFNGALAVVCVGSMVAREWKGWRRGVRLE